MTTLDTVRRMVEHATRHGLLDHRLGTFAANPHAVNLTVQDLPGFLAWARTLAQPLYTGHAYGETGELVVTGNILSGHQIGVIHYTDPAALTDAGLVGVLVYGQIEQFARKAVTA